jgi:hypothetical protein
MAAGAVFVRQYVCCDKQVRAYIRSKTQKSYQYHEDIDNFFSK